MLGLRKIEKTFRKLKNYYIIFKIQIELEP